MFEFCSETFPKFKEGNDVTLRAWEERNSDFRIEIKKRLENTFIYYSNSGGDAKFVSNLYNNELKKIKPMIYERFAKKSRDQNLYFCKKLPFLVTTLDVEYKNSEKVKIIRNYTPYN